MTIVLTDAYVSIGGTDVSDYVTSVTLPIQFEELEDTAMGASARSRVKGLQDSSITIEWNQSFASSELDSILWTAFTSASATTIAVRPTSSAKSATNPEYGADYLVSQYQPFGNKVGEKASVSTTWPLADSNGVTRSTS